MLGGPKRLVLGAKGGGPAKGRRGSAEFPIPDHLLHRRTPRLHAAQRAKWWKPYMPSSAPDRLSRSHAEREFGAFVRLTNRVSGDSTGKAALRADRETILVDEARRFLDPPDQFIDRFEQGTFGADEAEHHALICRHEAQWRKISRPRRVELEQEMRHAGAAEKRLGDLVIAAFG